MRKLFETYEAVDKVFIAANAYWHYYGNANTSASIPLSAVCMLVL